MSLGNELIHKDTSGYSSRCIQGNHDRCSGTKNRKLSERIRCTCVVCNHPEPEE